MVSVVVSSYNHCDYIGACLDGILMQETSFPFEIILGEDESNDGTREICIKYAEKHPDTIRLFLRSREDVIYINGNPTGRFNFLECLKAGKGKYIALCEGDDYWTDPLKLQKQVDFMEANLGFGICFHKVKLFNEETHEFLIDTITRNVNEITNIAELVKGNFMHTPSVMLRNDFTIPAWFKESPLGDWTLYMLAIKGRNIKKFDKEMAVYRQHNESIWSKKSKEYRVSNTLKSFSLIYDNLLLPKDPTSLLREKIKYLTKVINQLSK